MFRRPAVVALAGCVALGPGLAAAANFDVAAGDAAALAQAITDANANPDADTITLAGGTYSFTTLSDTNSALPSVTTEITIVGNGAVIERASSSVEDMRILRLAFSANLTLRNLTIRGGRLTGQGIAGGGILVTSGQLTIENGTVADNFCDGGGFGGGLYAASGPVTIRDSTITGNRATIGGGIEVFGPGNVALERTTVVDNTAQPDGTTPATGGGIALRNGGVLALTDVTVSGNHAQGSVSLNGVGGGIASDESTATITRTTIADNVAMASGTASALGGGIAATGNGPSFTISNGTITGNATLISGSGTGDGAGIYVKAVNAVWTLNNVTIADNNPVFGVEIPLAPRARSGVLTRGGGIFLGNPGSIGSDAFTLSNTILGDNAAATGPDCFTDSGKTIASTGYNLVDVTTDCSFTSQSSDLTGQSPLLAPLADNGGPTQTMALLAGSTAENAGSPANVGDAGACEAIDQRCYARPAGGRCDIGAFEQDAVNLCASTTTTTTTSPTTTTTPGGCGARAATFASIECRLDLLIADLGTSGALGKLQKGLVSGATAARTRTKSADDLSGSGKPKPAKKKLEQAGRRLLGVLHRLKSLTARKKIPGDVRQGFIDEGTPIQADLKALASGL